jgi:hypothetical protein
MIHVFGAAAFRDDAKRPEMGKVSATYANVIILTEEDYRTEDPERIFNMIAQGIDEKGFTEIHPSTEKSHIPNRCYMKILNREEAIAKAISIAQPGAYDTHLSAQDIDKLGDFIEGILTDESSDTGDSRIVIQLKAIVLKLFEKFRIFRIIAHDMVCIHDHGAKLKHSKRLAVLPHAHGGICEYGTFGVKLYGDRYEDTGDREYNDEDKRERYIHSPLYVVFIHEERKSKQDWCHPEFSSGSSRQDTKLFSAYFYI